MRKVPLLTGTLCSHPVVVVFAEIPVLACDLGEGRADSRISSRVTALRALK